MGQLMAMVLLSVGAYSRGVSHPIHCASFMHVELVPSLYVSSLELRVLLRPCTYSRTIIVLVHAELTGRHSVVLATGTAALPLAAHPCVMGVCEGILGRQVLTMDETELQVCMTCSLPHTLQRCTGGWQR